MKNALIRGLFIIPLQSCNSITHVYQDTKVTWKLYSVFTYEDFTLEKTQGKYSKIKYSTNYQNFTIQLCNRITAATSCKEIAIKYVFVIKET